MQSLCDRWEFVSDWYDGFAVGEGEGECVRLPHTVKEIPQHYADSQSYQMVCGYRKKLTLSPAKGMRLDCAHNFAPEAQNSTLARRSVFFRSAEPPDKMDFHFISPCGAKLYEVFSR